LQELAVAGSHWSFIDTGGKTKDARVPLILLPGSVGTCEVFFKQVAALGADGRIIAATYPALADPEDLADGLAAFMTELELDRAHVLGSSFAGYWIQYAALRHPERIETLVLGNTFLEPGGLLANPLFAPDLILQGSAGELQRVWLERAESGPDSELRTLQIDMLSGRQDAETLRSRLVGVVQARPCPEAEFPRERIVIIDCDDDPIITPFMRRAVRARYAGARAYALRTGGHYPHILNPGDYNAVLRVLLTG